MVNAGNVCGQVSSSRAITFQSPPSILPKANPAQVCFGDSTILYESLGTGADSIVWTGPGISALTGSQVKIKPPGTGVLQYTETAYTQDRKCVASQKVNVQVLSGPPPALQIMHSGCAEPMVFRVSSLANGGANPQIRWYRNDTLINTGDSVISLSKVPKGASIHATVKIFTPCAATDSAVSNTIVVDCINGRSDIPGIAGFSILPNPSNGRFTVRMYIDEPRKVAIEVYNAYGNQVALINEATLRGTVQRNIDLQTQPAGVYYLRLWVDGKLYVFRLLVVR